MKTPRGSDAIQPTPDDPEQSKRFEEMARELEADKNAEQFDQAIKSVVPPVLSREEKDKERETMRRQRKKAIEQEMPRLKAKLADSKKR